MVAPLAEPTGMERMPYRPEVIPPDLATIQSSSRQVFSLRARGAAPAHPTSLPERGRGATRTAVTIYERTERPAESGVAMMTGAAGSLSGPVPH